MSRSEYFQVSVISGEIDTERSRCGEYWPAAAAYAGLACGTSCEEVSPRPVRTDAALGLRAFWGSDGADGGQDRTDPPAPLAGADPAPCHDVRQSKKRLVVGALVAILEPVSNAGLAYELE